MGTLDMSHLININKERGWALLLEEPVLPHVVIGHLLITPNIRKKWWLQREGQWFHYMTSSGVLQDYAFFLVNCKWWIKGGWINWTKAMFQIFPYSLHIHTNFTLGTESGLEQICFSQSLKDDL